MLRRPCVRRFANKLPAELRLEKRTEGFAPSGAILFALSKRAPRFAAGGGFAGGRSPDGREAAREGNVPPQFRHEICRESAWRIRRIGG
jgi:hypothetical protein